MMTKLIKLIFRFLLIGCTSSLLKSLHHHYYSSKQTRDKSILPVPFKTKHSRIYIGYNLEETKRGACLFKSLSFCLFLCSFEEFHHFCCGFGKHSPKIVVLLPIAATLVWLIRLYFGHKRLRYAILND